MITSLVGFHIRCEKNRGIRDNTKVFGLGKQINGGITWWMILCFERWTLSEMWPRYWSRAKLEVRIPSRGYCKSSGMTVEGLMEVVAVGLWRSDGAFAMDLVLSCSALPAYHGKQLHPSCWEALIARTQVFIIFGIDIF